MSAPAYVTPSLLWARHSAAYAAARAREELARSDAFYDDVHPIVCGEAIRVMTPEDVLTLERLKNPLVTGTALAEIGRAHVAQFLWLLSSENSGGLLAGYRFRRFLRRTAAPAHPLTRDLTAALNEVVAYLEIIMQDAPAAAQPSQAEKMAAEEGVRRPVGAHFLALILVPLAVEVGLADPYDGRPWQFTPLPRIFQYLKVAAARADGRSFTDDSPHRQIEADWLREVNAARNAGVLIGEGDIPGSRELAHLTPADLAPV